MAFNVTPTSGTAPYSFTATFLNKYLLDGVNYNLLMLSTNSTVSCPAIGSLSTVIGGASSLLSNGAFTLGASVAPGSCTSYSLIIVRVSDSFVVQRLTVSVSNL